MPMRRPMPRNKGEPTIALINIVFLMLIFFMIAGALAPPLDSAVALIDTDDFAGRSPPDAAVVFADGSVRYRDTPITAAEIVAQTSVDTGEVEPSVRIVPDRDLPAEVLMRIAGELRAAGAGEVWLVTERGLE